ncbi:PA2778 family cysteine peptidase [Oceanicoccus sp. KOV_DT_Chl]|uniref:PA2778 family cysteine peptidase n=1 Tax=Oceanicoccus sp. KOV_DT_Chl TaxID=1904639 RepID=UPI0013582DC0|nr:PA2778 family cysteine peptidase [Oceanicoccus sp. KOV_DT_Chl]
MSKAARKIILASLFLLTACTSNLWYQIPEVAKLDSSRQLDNIPFFPQIEDQCGPASLATMLAVQGIDASPEQLRSKIYIPGKEGTVTTEIVARSRRYGLLPYPLRPELIDVLTEINAGNPVLVMQNLAYNWLPRWHFSVAIGYDLNQQTISLRSGKEKAHEVDFDLFVRTWQRADSWALVILRPERLPATAEAKTMISAANELEQVGETKAALAVYQAILAQWPDHPVAQFGAGNAAYSLADYRTAEQYFSAYVTLRPSAVEGWNNLAHTLFQTGCVIQAKTAINCGLRIQPENIILIESQQEITQTKSSLTKDDCRPINCSQNDLSKL